MNSETSNVPGYSLYMTGSTTSTRELLLYLNGKPSPTLSSGIKYVESLLSSPDTYQIVLSALAPNMQTQVHVIDNWKESYMSTKEDLMFQTIRDNSAKLDLLLERASRMDERLKSVEEQVSDKKFEERQSKSNRIAVWAVIGAWVAALAAIAAVIVPLLIKLNSQVPTP